MALVVYVGLVALVTLATLRTYIARPSATTGICGLDWIVARGTVPIPDDVAPEEASFVEPVNTCLKAKPEKAESKMSMCNKKTAGLKGDERKKAQSECMKGPA